MTVIKYAFYSLYLLLRLLNLMTYIIISGDIIQNPYFREECLK